MDDAQVGECARCGDVLTPATGVGVVHPPSGALDTLCPRCAAAPGSLEPAGRGLIATPGVAALAGVTVPAVHHWVRCGWLVPVYRGRVLLFAHDDVLEFIAAWQPRAGAGKGRAS